MQGSVEANVAGCRRTAAERGLVGVWSWEAKIRDPQAGGAGLEVIASQAPWPTLNA